MKIKTGLASFGVSGRVFHAPFVAAHSGFALTAVVERHAQTAQALYPDVQSVRSFEELLAQDIELVIVNTPNHLHYEQCKQALEAGKHVISEKPFVPTAAQARELIELARRRNLLLTVYQNRRFDGDFLTLQQLIASGALGRIVELESAFQRYRTEVRTGSWKEVEQVGIGITYDLCSHLVDQAVVLFGRPQGVWAQITRQRDEAVSDDYCRMILCYDKVQVSLKAGCLIREEAPRFALHGTRGSYAKYGLDPQEQALRNGAKPLATTWIEESTSAWGILHTDDGRVPYPTCNGNYMRYFDNIQEVLRGCAAPLVSHQEMISDLEILEAAFVSNRTGSTLIV